MGEVKTGHMTNKKGYRIFWQHLLPDGQPRGTIFISHGYAEHINRYQNVFDTLLPAGFQIFGIDLVGHGQSEGKRGYVEHFSDFVDDTRQLFTEQIEANLNGGKLFLLGHSMGSVVAMHYALKYADSLAGLILSGTGTSLDGTPKILTKLSSLISAVLPKLGVKSPFPSEFISHDPQVVSAYDDDPLVFAPHITIRLGDEFYKSCISGAQAIAALTLPLLIIYGSEDVSFSGQQDLFSNYSGEDKTLHCYQGARHEVFNEIPQYKTPALTDLRKWLEQRL